MTKPFSLPVVSLAYLRAGMRTSVLILGSLSSFAAYAQTYPVSGVWVAMDHQFPQSKAGACLTLKTFGVDALFSGSFPTVTIFSEGRRFVVRGGGRPAELAIKSVNIKDGGFRITESLGKLGSWLPCRIAHLLAVKYATATKADTESRTAIPRFIFVLGGAHPSNFRIRCPGPASPHLA